MTDTHLTLGDILQAALNKENTVMHMNDNAIIALTRYVVSKETGSGASRIETVKKLREVTGFGLKLAVRLVDACALPPRDPVQAVLDAYYNDTLQ